MSYVHTFPVPLIHWREVRVRVAGAARSLGVDASDLLRGSDEEMDLAIIDFAVANRICLDWLIRGYPEAVGGSREHASIFGGMP